MNRIGGRALLAVCLGFATASGQTASDTPLAAGLEAYHRQDWAGAIRLLGPLVESGGEQAVPGAAAALGLSYYFTGDYEKAGQLLDRASAREPGRAELAYPLAIARIRLRDAAGAQVALARLFRLEPASHQAGLLTARFLIRERLEDLAQIELDRLSEQGARLPQLHYLRGQLALYRGEDDRAIRELEQEIAINPAFDMAYYRLGDAYARKNQPEQAIGLLEKAIWLNPDFSSPYILLGRIHLEAGRHEAAEGMLSKAVAMDPNNRTTRFLLGTLYRQTGRAEAAREQFEMVRKLENPQ